MRNLIVIAVLAAVLCTFVEVQSAGEEEVKPQSVMDQIKQVMEYTTKLTNSIRELLKRRKELPKEDVEKLKELGGDLGNAERDLSEQMANMGVLLGIPKPEPPPKE